ncbi:MAG: hypothetical protein WD577_09305, partial [Bacteroidales bacterium]
EISFTISRMRIVLLKNTVERYTHLSDAKIYEKFVAIQGTISIEAKEIIVDMKKRRDLPLILETMNNYKNTRYDSFKGRTMKFTGATST